MDYKQARTDEERLAVIFDVPSADYNVLLQWERESQNKSYRDFFHNRAAYLLNSL